jgi:ADP-ribosyl-[dinitrogen reductase] hydrolase
MCDREAAGLWLRADLLSSRLPDGASLPDSIRWIDCDEELRLAGGELRPGRIALTPAWVARLWRWRLAGLSPLIATCTLPVEADASEGQTAALELDLLSGGTLDAIRVLSPPTLPILSSLPTVAPARVEIAIPDGATLERIRGALLGLAVGDCLGAPVENWPADKIAKIHGPFRDYVSGRGWGPGQPTRETVFALMWFREFAHGRSTHLPDDRDRLAAALERWVTGRPRDFGHLTRGILRAFRTRPPLPASREMWERAHRLPEFNAALSRAAAVGAAVPRDQELRICSAIAASVITHPAPVCLASAVAVAEGVAAAVRGEDPFAAARAVVWEERTTQALDQVAAGWRPGEGEWNGHERGHPLKTLQAAFWAIRQEGSLENVLLELAHTGGDADTHCAIAGAILGARDGIGAIPDRWLARLQVRTLIEGLAGRFERATPAPG